MICSNAKYSGLLAKGLIELKDLVKHTAVAREPRACAANITTGACAYLIKKVLYECYFYNIL